MAEQMMQDRANEKVAKQTIPAGYKQTEVGVIPEDWLSVQLKQLFVLKNGYAFKGEFFSDKGPVVLTPGNFKLDGGLYFEMRNTKRYSAIYPNSYELKRDDLVVVMTDLTPECNLLGKPAFIEGDEVLLLNQRIGKVERLVNSWDKKFLFYTLLSPNYLSTIKNAATGSTVRHTSPDTIASAWVYEPPKKEQIAIANVLSDTDALIGVLKQLFAKKQAIKSATMQQLLTGRTRLPAFALRPDGTPKGYKPSELGDIPEDWEVAPFGNLFETSISRKNLRTTDLVSFVGMQDVTEMAQLHNQTSISYEKVKAGFTYFERGDILVAKITPCFENGKGCYTKDLSSDVGFGSTEFHVLRAAANADSVFIYYWTTQNSFRNKLEPEMVGSAGHRRVPFPAIQSYLIPCSMSKQEQTAIATILSDMDNELTALEQKLAKARDVKQGMMQQLLTGRIRLPLPQEA